MLYLGIIKKLKYMKKYLLIDLEECKGASVCDTKEEVIEGCGYEVGEIEFEDLLEKVRGIYEIIEIVGEINYLN
jgi:hypothetical protein